MKQNKDKSYKCCICDKPTNTLHEVFFGSANRRISEKYGIQVPLCNTCHLHAHAGAKDKWIFCYHDYFYMNKKQIQEYFCVKIGIYYKRIKNALNNYKSGGKEYLERLNLAENNMTFREY